MERIFNKYGVPHLSTPNSCAPLQDVAYKTYREDATRPQAAKDFSHASNTGEDTEIPDREDELQKLVEERLRYELENESNSDSESDSDKEPIGDSVPNAKVTGEPTASALVGLADCHDLPNYGVGPNVSREADTAAGQDPRTWSTRDARTTTPLDAFFKHYFLSDSKKRSYWTPNRRKTRDPIILYGATDINKVHSVAKRVHGLETCSAGAPPNRCIVLGWDRLAVWRRASEVSATSYSEDVCRYIFDTAQRFAKAMDGAHDRPRLNKAERWADNAMHGILDHFQGSYLVRWRDVGGGWDVRAVLRLEIGTGPRKNILEATVRFPGVEETMLLANSKEVLDAYLDATLKEGAESYGHGENDKVLKSEEGKEPAKNAQLGTTGNPIRSALDSGEHEGCSNDDLGTMNNPIKISFVAELCYHVVGRTTSGCHGRLHWNADQTFTSFTGEGYLPCLSNRVEMQGFEY